MRGVLLLLIVLVLSGTVGLLAWRSRLQVRLRAADALIATIQDRCLDMASVGDPTAQTILDDIRSYNKELNK